MSQQYTGKSNINDHAINDHAQPTTSSFHTATDATFHWLTGWTPVEGASKCVFKGAHKANKCNVITDPKERLACVR